MAHQVIGCMQAEHAQALCQEQNRTAAIKIDFETQLQSTQRQLALAQDAAEQAHTAERQAKRIQQESASVITQLQVLHAFLLPS